MGCKNPNTLNRSFLRYTGQFKLKVSLFIKIISSKVYNVLCMNMIFKVSD